MPLSPRPLIAAWVDAFNRKDVEALAVVNGHIVFQRGYWDKLTFLRQHELPLPRD
jgi:hypothetical protein